MSSRPLAALLAVAWLCGGATPCDARITYDMATHVATLRIDGSAPGENFGAPLATGDVNGDGFADLIIADQPPINTTNPEAGRLYVFFGGPTFFATSRKTASAADVFITTSRTIAIRAGAGIPAIGDVDGDGIDDILIGSPTGLMTCPMPCGGTWVVLGRRIWPATIDVSRDAHWTFQGTALRFGLGDLIDLDGDGRDDVLLRQPDSNTTNGTLTGRVLVYFSSGLTPGQFVDTARVTPDRVIIGQAPSARQTGLRECELDDAAPAELAVQSGALASARAFPLAPDLPAGPTIDLAATAGLAILEDPDVSKRSSLLSREDVDGDGLPDEIVAASGDDWMGRVDNGSACVRLAAPPLAIGQQRVMGPTVSNWIAHGPVDGGNGSAQIVPDLTGDGLSDLLFRLDGDTAITTPRMLLLPMTHGACVRGVIDVDLDTESDVLAWLPGRIDDFFGTGVAVADFDGDGLNDIALGAPDADGVAASDQKGQVVVERGQDDWDRDGLSDAADCAPFDATAGARPAEPLLMVSGTASTTILWGGGPIDVSWHALTGTISSLWSGRGFASASVLARDLSAPQTIDSRAMPGASSDGYWYLVAAENGCGFDDLGTSAAADDLQRRLCTLLP